jgi:hypothetical protein
MPESGKRRSDGRSSAPTVDRVVDCASHPQFGEPSRVLVQSVAGDLSPVDMQDFTCDEVS